MKILLLGFGKIAYMPYMHLYLDNIENADFDLIYWDRDGKKDDLIPSKIKHTYKYEAFIEEQLPFKKKLKYFYGYRKFAKQILKKNKYDRIIVLHTTPGLTLMDYLILHYKNKYLLDFRDVSYEYISFYRKLVGILSNNASKTFVSSDAFRKYLPKKSKIYTVHNFLNDSINYKGIGKLNTNLKKIKISYWGLIRQVEINKKIMDALGNDKRFELHYYGRMQQDGRDMEKYAVAKNYKNIYFHGSYMPEERYEFAKNTDIIHNIYDVNPVTGNAMGNKYYDSIIFKIPQLCTKDSYMGKRATSEGVGLELSLDEGNIANSIWEYYNNLDKNKYNKACELALKKVLEEQAIIKSEITKFLK